MALWFMIALGQTGEIPRGLAKTFKISVAAAVAAFLSLGVGSSIHHWKIYQTRSFVAKLVPQLDAFKSQHGKYPNRLAELERTESLPLLAVAYNYSADDSEFRFEYWDDSGMMESYSFDSTDRKWRRFD